MNLFWGCLLECGSIFNLGEVFLLYQHLSTWQIIMVVVFPILTSALATFVIAMFTFDVLEKTQA